VTDTGGVVHPQDISTERTYGWAEPRLTRCRIWWLDVNQSHLLELEKKVMLNTSLDGHHSLIGCYWTYFRWTGELTKSLNDVLYQSFTNFTKQHLQANHTPSLKHPNPAIQRFGEFSLQATRRMEGTPSSFNAVGVGWEFGRLGGYVDKDPEGLTREVGTKCLLINMTSD